MHCLRRVAQSFDPIVGVLHVGVLPRDCLANGRGKLVLFRVSDIAGDVPQRRLTVLGNTAKISLRRKLGGSPRVSYGYSTDPAQLWLTDLSGTPVPCFKDVPVLP